MAGGSAVVTTLLGEAQRAALQSVLAAEAAPQAEVLGTLQLSTGRATAADTNCESG